MLKVIERTHLSSFGWKLPENVDSALVNDQTSTERDTHRFHVEPIIAIVGSHIAIVDQPSAPRD
ncbi:uncharacterized protein ACA1_044430 [Acanthamoeba castellanii str. Neff]|uniref:Uncharacterized protein n=1 Tax=Acanthamoeba castellanii (strain ATCC 30010 / Neff) TaxID=1257118 RepID=L8H118_ACACF|nr:uncharacterized protein ACA1_044430 [Acanthamoeba castellanii str. Neff]ELR18463.1 hypothetical protein ACA1_044430 [Acanthamoeba castellanii str. Neff]